MRSSLSLPLPNPEPHPRSNRRSLRKLRTAVVECRRQRLKRRRRRSRVVELHRSIHAVSRASGEPWHRAKAAMLVADCASEALTTEDELRRERSGVQCEAQASLSALRRELPPAAPRVLLSSCGFCCSSTLCLGFRTPYVNSR